MRGTLLCPQVKKKFGKKEMPSLAGAMEKRGVERCVVVCTVVAFVSCANASIIAFGSIRPLRWTGGHGRERGRCSVVKRMASGPGQGDPSSSDMGKQTQRWEPPTGYFPSRRKYEFDVEKTMEVDRADAQIEGDALASIKSFNDCFDEPGVGDAEISNLFQRNLQTLVLSFERELELVTQHHHGELERAHVLYEEAKRTLQEERRKVQSLEEVLRESEQELSLAASKSNEALKSQVDELKKELRGSAEQMAKLKSGLVDQNTLKGEVDELKGMLRRSVEKLDAQEKASAGSDAETKKLKAEGEELKGKLQLSAEEVAKLKSRCAAQSELLDQAKGSKSEAIKAAAGSDAVETKKLKAEVAELKGKLQLSAEEVSKLKSRCAAQSELLNQAKGSSSEAIKPVAGNDQETRKLKAEVAELQGMLLRAADQVTKLQGEGSGQETASLKAQVDDLKKMHQLSAEEVVKLNSRCAALSELADQVQGSKSEAIKAAASSDAETKKLKAEVEELKGKLQLSAEEVAKLKSRCAALSDLADQTKESKLEAMKRAAAGSDTAETKKLKAEVEELRGKLQLSDEEVAKLKSRCAALSKVADQNIETRQEAKSRREQQTEAELQVLKAQLAEATAAGKVQTAPAVGASADRLKEPTKTVQRQGVDSHFFTPILKEGINEKEPRTNIAEDTLKSGLTKPLLSGELFTWAAGLARDAEGGRSLLREVVKSAGGATLDMPESFAGHVREKYLDGDNNFYSALAVEFTRIGMPLKSKSTFGPTFGSVLGIAEASRLVRSEVLMYGTAHAAKYAKVQSPFKELAVAASKFNVQITCFDLIKGVVSKKMYFPQDGVVPRAMLVLGRDGDKFWSCLPYNTDIDSVQSQSQDIVAIPTGSRIPVGYDKGDENVTPITDSLSTDSSESMSEQRDKVGYESALDKVIAKYGTKVRFRPGDSRK